MKKRKVIKSVALATAVSLSLSASALYLYNGLFRWNYNRNIEKNAYEYATELQNYNEFLEQYAKYINSLELSDMEIFVKVMKDIWEDIDGYGKADDIIHAYYRLSFQEEGKGVCTSFADDFTARINAINPNYDAKMVVVSMGEEDLDVERLNIERKKLSENSENNESAFTKIYGNHAVSIVYLKDYNLYMMVDPTNLFIGIFRNGKIDILDVKDNGYLDFKYNSSTHYTSDSYKEIFGDYLKTFSRSNLSNEEIVSMFGYEAQVNALDKINVIDEETPRLVKLR